MNESFDENISVWTVMGNIIWDRVGWDQFITVLIYGDVERMENILWVLRAFNYVYRMGRD